MVRAARTLTPSSVMNKLKWKEHKAPVKEEMASRMAYVYVSCHHSRVRIWIFHETDNTIEKDWSYKASSIPIKLLQWFPFLLDMLGNSAPVHRVRYTGRSNTSSGCCNWPLQVFLISGLTQRKKSSLLKLILDSDSYLATPKKWGSVCAENSWYWLSLWSPTGIKDRKCIL